MNKALRRMMVVAFVSAMAMAASAQSSAPAPASAPNRMGANDASRQKALSLLKQMSLKEKILQMAQAPGYMNPEAAAKRGVGSILWVESPDQIYQLQKIAVEQSRLHIPVLFGYDVIHGYRTIFPDPLAMASSWDPAMVEGLQATAAREARANGIAWSFGPMVDIARDPRWGRIMEGAGEDPYLGAAMARAQVYGFQGRNGIDPTRVLSSVKHFAGYGAADGGRDYDSAYVSEQQMWNVYLPPFEAAVKAGSGTLMSAYMDLNDVPATGNRWLLDEVLRKTWGFQGFVVSDAIAVRSLITHGYARDEVDAALKAVRAGVNMDMAGGIYETQLEKLVADGRVPESRIDELVLPILEAKIRIGLFENPYRDEALVKRQAVDPAIREQAREAARRSAVLLRNQPRLLPLDPSGATIKSIAVIGQLADDATAQMTMWGSSCGDHERVVTLLHGLQKAVGDRIKIEYAQGPLMRRESPSMFEMSQKLKQPPPQTSEEADKALSAAVEAARRSDVVVLALGETALMFGEKASRSTLKLPGRQQELLEAVVAVGKPVVLVLVNGRPLDISWADAHVPSILELWAPGAEGGDALADILFGRANPGGKLPVTWPRSSGQIPVYYAHTRTQDPEDAPGFVSRYTEAPSKPLYPFGYGLSYSSFAFSNLQLDKSQLKNGESLVVSFDVANTGAVAGDEVAQLYIHQRSGEASRPVRLLKGFERVNLQPGEKKTLRFTLGPDELRYWSADQRRWLLDSSAFDLWVGADSQASLHAEFKVVD